VAPWARTYCSATLGIENFHAKVVVGCCSERCETSVVSYSCAARGTTLTEKPTRPMHLQGCDCVWLISRAADEPGRSDLTGGFRTGRRWLTPGRSPAAMCAGGRMNIRSEGVVMAAISGTGQAGSSAIDKDVAELHRLGYAQELRRRMGAFSNFAVSFTIISVLSGCLTLYFFGMQEGGPVDIVWGWILVGIMTTVVGLGMAEIASKYPTAGGSLLLVGQNWPRTNPAPGAGSPAGSICSARWPSQPASTTALPSSSPRSST